jgi:hypothetical protein
MGANMRPFGSACAASSSYACHAARFAFVSKRARIFSLLCSPLPCFQKRLASALPAPNDRHNRSPIAMA